MSESSASAIQNVIVVMMENRSYDNVLGWLYDLSNQEPYKTSPVGQKNLKGLSGTESNPKSSGGTITVGNQTAPTRDSNTYTKLHGGVSVSPAPNSNHPGGADYPPTPVSEDNPHCRRCPSGSRHA